VVLLPSGGGELLVYEPLSRHVAAGHPILGLPFRGDRTVAQRIRSIDEQADAHLLDLLATAPRGPFVTVGYSSGGTLAIEVARRLRLLGQAVPLVVLIDAGFLSGPHGRHLTQHLLREDGVGGAVHHARWWFSLRRKAARAQALAKLTGAPEAVVAPEAVHDVRVFDTGAALRAHHPATYEGPVLYVQAEDAEGRSAERWRSVCAGTFTVKVVPGVHTGPGNLLEPSLAPGVAAAIDEVLAQLLGGSGS
jgi:thioesterase domain-containing protein